MKRMPILTSGRALVALRVIPAPIDDDGSDWAELTVADVSDEDASFLGSYWEAQRRFLGTGKVKHLKPFEGEVVLGRQVMADPDLIAEPAEGDEPSEAEEPAEAAEPADAELPLITDPKLIEEFDEDFGQVDVRELYEQGF
jgi:hypothetical protein